MRNETPLSRFSCGCQDTLKVLTLKTLDSSYSCELGYKFLAGSEVVNGVQGQGAKSSACSSKELDSEYFAVIQNKEQLFEKCITHKTACTRIGSKKTWSQQQIISLWVF